MRRLLTIIPLLLLASLAWAQHTTVTAQVIDSNGAIYVNCSGSASFVGLNTTPGAGPYLLGGSVFQTVVPLQCDSSGNLTLSLADNALISPSPSQWRFTICAPSGLSSGGVPPPICFNVVSTITGTAEDITTILTAAAPLLPTPGGGITGATVGGGLVQSGTTLGLLTTCGIGQILDWNGTAWTCFTPTGGGGTITGVLTSASSGLQGGGVAGTLNLSLLTTCSNNQVLQWNGTAWICGSALTAWSSLVPPTSNLSMSLFTGSTPYTTTFTMGDFGASPADAFTLTDNSTTSTDLSYNLSVIVPPTSYHNAARFSIDGFNQLQVCSTAGASHSGIIVVGSAITCPNLSTSPFSKTWILDSSANHAALTLYQNSAASTATIFRMNTVSSGTGFNFWTACPGATPSVDGTCPDGSVVAKLRGDGTLFATNLVNLAGTGVSLNGVTLSGAPTGTSQCPTSTSTSTATWQTCGSGGGGGTGNQFQSPVFTANNVIGAYGPGLANQVPVSQGASALPVFASAGVPGGNGGTGVVSAATYTIACDSGTTTLDRLTTIIFTNAAPTVTVPDAGASGCGSNFTFALIAATGTTITVNRTSSSTFTTINGNAYAAAQTTFTLTEGQYATVNSPDNTDYVARIVGGGSMSWPSGGAGIPNYSGSSSWGTTYTTTGSGTVVALATSPTFVTGITTPAITVSGSTAHYVAIGEGASALNFVTPDTAGFCLLSNGTSLDPTFQTCPAGATSFPITVGGTVTSGGVPYFDSVTSESSSGILNANILVKGGGAGNPPTNSSITDDGTTVSFAEGLAFSGTSGPATTISTTTASSNLILAPQNAVVVPAGSALQAGVIFSGASSTAGLGYITTNAFGFTNGTNWNTKFYPSGIVIATGGIFAWSATSSANGTVNTCLDHPSTGVVRVDSNTGCNDGLGKIQAQAYTTTANCAAAGSAANPSVAACSGASSGSVSCSTSSAGNCQVNTTAVTVNSVILLQFDSSLGSKLPVTCNTTASLLVPSVTARVASTSFTFAITTPATNPACYNYMIVN